MIRLVKIARERRAAFRFALMLVGISVLAWLAWMSRHEFLQLAASLSSGRFLLAVLLGVLLTLIQAQLFSSLYRRYVDGANGRALVSAFLVSQPGKYIPGKVWSVLIQSGALNSKVRIGQLALANIDLTVVTIIQVTFLGICCSIHDARYAWPVMILGVLAGALAFKYSIAEKIIRLSPRLTSVFGIALDAGIGESMRIRTVAPLIFASMMVNLAASMILLSAVGVEISSDMRLPLLSVLYLSLAISVLTFVIPAGLGIREALSAGVGLVMLPDVPVELILSAALLFRFWQILVDFVCLVVGALFAPR